MNKNPLEILPTIYQQGEQEAEKKKKQQQEAEKKKKQQQEAEKKKKQQEEAEKKKKHEALKADSEEKQKKSYGSQYMEHIKTAASSDVDPITLENITDLPSAYIMRVGLKGFQPYEVDVAYDLYVKKNLKNLFTREPIPDVQKQRIEIYKQFHDKFPKYQLNHEIIGELLIKYLNNDGKVSEDERLQLKRFLSFDMSDAVFSGLGLSSGAMTSVQRMAFREIATKALDIQPVGSWIIRPSSIDDDVTNKIYIRVVTIKRKTGVYHIPVIHVWGYGYILTDAVARGQSLSKLNFTKLKGVWLPSLIDVLSLLSTTFQIPIILSRYYRVEKSLYMPLPSLKK